MNDRFVGRLGAIRKVLMAGHEGGAGLSAATVGREREHFMASFLRNVLPAQFRTGTGDIIDTFGEHSGQVDGVVEYPFLPSFPTMQYAPRLYLAESVAAVIEVKSNLVNQWDEVLATRDKLRPIRRAWRSRDAGAKGGAPTAIGTMSGESVERIPLIAVGYTGWKTIDTVQKKLEGAGLHCVLVLDEGLAAGPMGHNATGDASLGLLLETLQMDFGAVTMNSGALFPYWT